jgi:DNA-binding transcriptional MerR regulator
MTTGVSIGEFSTMTRLSRKALRHYHEAGVLAPAAVDPVNGYRYYDITQVPDALLIRRLRDLDLPVPELKTYLAADETDRGRILGAHLDRMRAQLRQTQDAIEALQGLLTRGLTPQIEIRHDAPVDAVAITETVRLADILTWWPAACRELDQAVRTAGRTADGPIGGFYDHALFADEQGPVTLFLPVTGVVPESERVHRFEAPGGWFAVAVHDGPDARLDESYAVLGRFVTEHAIGADGPVRERYLAGALDDPRPLVTEIAWPITEPPV